LRQTQVEKLRTDSKLLLPSIEQLEQQIQALDDEANADKKLCHLARLLYVGQLVEQTGLLYSLNEQAFCHFLADNKNTLQKPIVK
jgi:hypothetical protein